MNWSRTRTRARKAVTLLELLLALSLMVAVAAIAMPTVGNTFTNRRLTIAAEQFRSDLLSTRVKAINTGTTFMVRYVPQSGMYTIGPYQGDLAVGVGGEAAILGEGSAMGDLDIRDLQIREQLLPEGILFLGAEGLLDFRDQEILDELRLSRADQGTSLELPPMFLFCYPDGTTSTARVAVANDRGRCIVLELRGLTGVLTLSEIMMQEELLQ